MDALLWTLVIAAAFTIIGVIVGRFENPIPLSARQASAAFSIGMGAWALVLLLSGS